MAEIKLLRGRREIERAAKDAASQILGWLGRRDYGVDDKIIFLGVMKGGLPWMFKVIDSFPHRYLLKHTEVAFVRLRSYAGTESTGKVTWDFVDTEDISEWEGADVIVFEDVVDSGASYDTLQTVLEEAKLNSLRWVVMAVKDNNHKGPMRHLNRMIDFVGFECDTDDFLVGFGLDYNEKYRTLDYIGRLCSTS